MARPVLEIIADIENFEPSDKSWLGLEELLDELFSSGSADTGIDAMLRIFERYPGEDGDGVFWSIVHGLESLPGYEAKLVEAIRKTPSDFTVLMVNRLLNVGCREVGEVPLLPLLKQIEKDETVCPKIRQRATKIIDRHKLPTHDPG